MSDETRTGARAGAQARKRSTRPAATGRASRAKAGDLASDAAPAPDAAGGRGSDRPADPFSSGRRVWPD
jgi:hypothetical protein